MFEELRKRRKRIKYIPLRYVIAIAICIFEICAVIGIVVALSYYVRWFYILCWLTEIGCVLRIISSDDNPDYKVPWLLFVLILPIAGFMLYFMFYSRHLKPKYVKRLSDLRGHTYEKDDTKAFSALDSIDKNAHNQAKMLTSIADTHLFTGTTQEYFPLGDDMHPRLLEDLKNAEKFIFMEYFIIEEGVFWNSILDILKEKAANGVDVRVIYDDIGCMLTLPGNYVKKLRSLGINATTFSKLRGSADGEFNNRNHRKITVIDGKIGYTGGVNLADEYINLASRFGHWKDNGIRLEGEAVWELTKMFLVDYGINTSKSLSSAYPHDLYPTQHIDEHGCIILFGDGPHPIYQHRIGKSIIQNMLAGAVDYVWLVTPYLIIDNDLCQDIENTALKGVDVRIIVPHIPDKKIVFEITQSYYHRLLKAGVRIFEYEPGFVHAKTYISDDKYAMIGTINLDYRSLVHHFENGIWMYRCSSIYDMKRDISFTFEKSIEITSHNIKKVSIFRKFVRSVVKIFAPML